MRIRVVDAFTDRAFAGNPAGVCVVERWPDAPWMQRVAAELNLSETAFARPRPDGDWDLRWFTPTVEVDLCGHATLATAHALAEDELIDDVVGFHTRSGVLTVRVGDDVTPDFLAAARDRAREHQRSGAGARRRAAGGLLGPRAPRDPRSARCLADRPRAPA